MSHNIRFVKEVKTKKDKNILKIAKDAKIKIKAPCRGKGKCGKCLVRILEGKVSEPTKAELKLISEKKIKLGYRLACEVTALGDVVIDLEDKK